MAVLCRSFCHRVAAASSPFRPAQPRLAGRPFAPVAANVVAPFHASAPAFVKVGDRLPDLDVLMENSPGNKVNLASELGPSSGKAIIIGVPAAFSPSCSESHIPGYLNHPKLRASGKVFVVSVNDAFVMKAWSEQLDAKKASGVRFLADPSCEFTNALDLAFDSAAAIFGGPRSKRYALELNDGKVTGVHVEPDNTGVEISAAEKVLGSA